MKYLHKVVSACIAIVFLATATPAEAAKARPPYANQTIEWDKDIDGNEIEGFDGQAYFASRYIPSLRPVTVVGLMLGLGALAVILQNTSHSSGHSH